MRIIFLFFSLLSLAWPSFALAGGCHDTIGEYRQRYGNDAEALEALNQLEAICQDNPDFLGPIKRTLNPTNPQYTLKVIQSELQGLQKNQADKKVIAPQ